MKHLYFVRHGESEANQNNVFSAMDAKLTEEGLRQAAVAGRQAKALNIDTIVSSPVPRALETAQIIAGAIGYPKQRILINKDLSERDYGQLIGRSWTRELDLSNKDMESLDELFARAQRAYSWLKSLDGQNILVVSHGAFGRALRQQILDIPYTERAVTPPHLAISNGQIIRWL